ncbi:MAG: SDR family oxidoreductase [Burkholderiales bacterium]|jgi:NAD(P)-dependent dehydrogenase (short-subunit alcohol dehydrogenase family)|uniref:SDR family oxidoreductase n=1 Tax=Polynucleobacter sp. UK-FUSCHL-C3 TaxID=2955208 RepID=A0AAU8A3U9_9BURK|nr:SDR family oxidoreductase [Burkholderiales bacterium]
MQINNLVLITGASQGIGRAIATRVIQDGYRVINLDKKAPKSLLEGETYHSIDLMDPQAIEELIPKITKQEPILRLVNNAGFIRPGALENTTLDDFEAVMALNLRAPMLLAQQLLPHMRQAKFGRIVSIASRAALGKEERTVYAASKAGLVGMTKTWALEMAKFGITVNAIGPGPIATELFTSGNPPDDPKTIKIIQNIPVQRMGQPEDVAHAVASLLDDRAGFITGQIHFVCGGMTVGLSNAT